MEELVDRFRHDCADGGYVDVFQLFPQLTLDMYAPFVLLLCSSDLTSALH